MLIIIVFYVHDDLCLLNSTFYIYKKHSLILHKFIESIYSLELWIRPGPCLQGIWSILINSSSNFMYKTLWKEKNSEESWLLTLFITTVPKHVQTYH